MAKAIPNKFKLFNKTWTIRPAGHNELKDDMGMCYVNDLDIAYDMTNYPADEVRHIIAHELVHSIEQSLQLELTERQVDLLALGLIDLLTNNPDITDYLKGTL